MHACRTIDHPPCCRHCVYHCRYHHAFYPRPGDSYHSHRCHADEFSKEASAGAAAHQAAQRFEGGQLDAIAITAAAAYSSGYGFDETRFMIGEMLYLCGITQKYIVKQKVVLI